VKGLLVLGAKPKALGKPMASSEPKGGAEKEYAREAFSALQDGDEDGFVSAFLGAVRACAGKAEASDYEDEDADDDEM
jgi:hypothetical protein